MSSIDLQKLIQTINDINSITHKNLADLEVGNKYAIVRLEATRTPHGDRICVHYTETLKLYYH